MRIKTVELKRANDAEKNRTVVADFSVVDYIAIYTSINKNNWVSVSKIMKFGFIKRENQPIIRQVHSHCSNVTIYNNNSNSNRDHKKGVEPTQNKNKNNRHTHMPNAYTFNKTCNET